MFSRRTVFVIGAGASAECGLPEGSRLKGDIENGLRFGFRSDPTGDNELWEILRLRENGNKDRLGLLRKCANDLARTVRTFPSIDEALHWWRRIPETVDVGKLAIAHYILKAERESFLAPNKQTGRVDIGSANDTWLAQFLSMVLSGLPQEKSSNAFNDVVVINFNYDRSLEHYLFHALQNVGLDKTAAIECIARLKIIRPYGSLGHLPWQTSKGGIDFGSSNSSVQIAPHIRTFTEQISGPNIASIIDAEFSEAELVIFLGFGFHQQNMELLEPIAASSRKKVRAVFATMYRIDERNYSAIEARLNDRLALSPKPTLVDLTSFQLLSKLRMSISMLAG
ncbi:MAG TPA: hypothetical protein VFB29_02190 [Pseudolabrys sp.]|nr:hypothetical protein [Pseudolabrys sp.]